MNFASPQFVYMRSLCGIATAARPRTATHDYAASCHGLCTGRVFHPAQRPVNGHPPSRILILIMIIISLGQILISICRRYDSSCPRSGCGRSDGSLAINRDRSYRRWFFQLNTRAATRFSGVFRRYKIC